ncbi:MAG: sulfate reduction electron transfer complex DsrMKJOP subunit DsrJ [Deltaproteobacteria bacterium]|nr:sulfate reduction electron transfer complex DsrMKJOP subunit DsrJ [Deltaproteobacteria bacterium]MBW1911961.1 sulfate reduction electron transfer complex DsrMKJOP subunit DsrJ [Deltaproteobacteria bacterium]
MYDGGKIVTGLIIFLILLLFPIWYQFGKAEKAPEPELTETAKKAEQCVEPKPFMKTQHMKMLDQWRDETVRGGERYYKSSSGKVYYKSLQVTCLECHNNKSKFCDQCHNYIGVDPFCWDCHVEPKEYE